MNSKFRLILASVIVILLAILGYFYFKNPSQKVAENTPSGNSVNLPTPTPTPTPTTTATAKNANPSLKTYVGNGYSVDYPSDWSVSTPSADEVDFSPDAIAIFSYKESKAAALSALESKLAKDGLEVQKNEITIPAGPATFLVASKPDTDFRVQYVVIGGANDAYSLSFGPQLGVNDEVFQKFYSSFKLNK